MSKTSRTNPKLELETALERVLRKLKERFGLEAPGNRLFTQNGSMYITTTILLTRYPSILPAGHIRVRSDGMASFIAFRGLNVPWMRPTKRFLHLVVLAVIESESHLVVDMWLGPETSPGLLDRLLGDCKLRDHKLELEQ